MRVAVVGAGVSGLATAYLLARDHEVLLFERERDLGGHAHTELVVDPQLGELPVDTGFIVYNEHTYPGFSALLQELEVPTQPAEMSFGVRCLACRTQFSSRGLRGFFAEPRDRLRPAHWRTLRGLFRFHRDARALLDGGGAEGWTLGDYLRSGRVGDGVARHYLVPVAASVWSTSPGAVEEFPLDYLLRFLDNHGLVGHGHALQWRTVTGGSREYVRRLLAALPAGTARTSAAVAAVTREPSGASIITDDGDRQRVDAVVLATHADEALALLTDPSPEERAALEAFRYSENRVVLHADEGLLPPREHARASWNFFTEDCRRPGAALTMSYDLTRLQSLPGRRRYLVSVNPGPELDERAVLREFAYSHPSYSFDTLAGQRRVEELQGERATYFAGAHLGYGFHEDGYRAGARVAALIGERAVPRRPVGAAP